jgi:hypothetical protein
MTTIKIIAMVRAKRQFIRNFPVILTEWPAFAWFYGSGCIFLRKESIGSCDILRKKMKKYGHDKSTSGFCFQVI